MRVVLLGLLAGCSFPHGALDQTNGPSDGPGSERPIDGAIDSRPLDAKVFLDAPCPDDDADGVCNNVDDWPCGAKPSAAASPFTMSGNSGATLTTITNVNLDNTMRYAVINGGAGVTVPLTFHLNLADTACPSNCIDQLEAGWVDHVANTGNRFSTCLFDQTVQKNNPADTDLSFTVPTPNPASPKAYDLRVNLGQNYYCGANGNTGWWGGQVPTDVKTIARLCVY